MSTLDSLEPELVQIIVEYVVNSSPRTAKSIALVNKYLYSATNAVSNRYKAIVYEQINEEHIKGLVDRISRDDFSTGIQHLNVRRDLSSRTSRCDFKDYDLCFESIANLIGKIGKLRTLTWSSVDPIPRNILDSLHAHQPTATLRIFSFKRRKNDLDHLDATEAILAKSTALTHFRMQCSARPGSSPTDDYRLATFKRIIAQATKLEYAGVISDDFNIENDPSKDNAEGLPKLVPLQIKKPNSSIRSLTLDGRNLQLSLETLNSWKTIVDLSQLETLKFSRGIPTEDYFKNAKSMLSGLRSVSLNFAAVNYHGGNEILKAAQEYLYSCPPLKTVSLWAWSNVVNVGELIEQHGKTLESLQLHNKIHQYGVPRQVLTVDQIRQVRLECPRLADLTIDINREDEDFHLQDETQTMSCVTELSLFGSRLQRLQLYFDTYSKHGVLLYTPTHLPFGFHEDEEDDEEESDEDGDENDDDSEAEDDSDEQDEESVADGEVDGELHNAEEDNSVANTDAAPITASIEVSHDDSVQPPNQTSLEPAESSTPVETTNLVVRDSGRSPPAKKARTGDVSTQKPPIETYVIDIWKKVFADKETGARALDVKFGEWDSRDLDNRQKFLFEVRPHERDDRLGQCWVKMHRRKDF